MSPMRIGALLCATLVAVCLAVQPAGRTAEHASARAGEGEPIIGERPAKVKVPVVPFWPIAVSPGPVSIHEAEYPEAVRKARIEGLAVVEALVDLDGSVIDADVISSSGNGPLDQAALASAREAKFCPEKGRDLPVLKWVTIPYRFVLTRSKGIALTSSISLVTTERLAPPSEALGSNDSVLRPVRGLHFVRLKPVAARDDRHGRLVPDSAAIRLNNEAMMAACDAFRHRHGDSLRKPASCYLRSDWYYLVIDSGRCRVFQADHSRYPCSRAEVYSIDTLVVKPGSLNSDYFEMPSWMALPQYAPSRLEFTAGLVLRTIPAPTFALEVP